MFEAVWFTNNLNCIMLFQYNLLVVGQKHFHVARFASVIKRLISDISTCALRLK